MYPSASQQDKRWKPQRPHKLGALVVCLLSATEQRVETFSVPQPRSPGILACGRMPFSRILKQHPTLSDVPIASQQDKRWKPHRRPNRTEGGNPFGPTISESWYPRLWSYAVYRVGDRSNDRFRRPFRRPCRRPVRRPFRRPSRRLLRGPSRRPSRRPRRRLCRRPFRRPSQGVPSTFRRPRKNSHIKTKKHDGCRPRHTLRAGRSSQACTGVCCLGRCDGP